MQTKTEFSLVKAVVREAARMLVLAWLSHTIESNNEQPQESSFCFKIDDFG